MKPQQRALRRAGTTLVAGLAILGLAACSSGATATEDDGAAFFEGKTVQVIIPTAAGGGFDTNARQLQPYLEDQLGATLVVQNLEGGGHAIGTQSAINRTQDCSTIMVHGVPHFNFSYLTQTVDYDLSDMAPLVGIGIEPGVLRVRADSPWNSLQDVIDAALADPGEIRVSLSTATSNNFVGMLDIQEATGAEFNIIPYDGGGPSRTALLSGEVDVTHAGVFNSLSIADDTKVLAVQQPENLWPDVTDDAPTVNEALGMEIADNASNYVAMVPEGCRTDYPLRYQAMVDAFNAAIEDPDYLASLDSLGELDKIDNLQPDDLQALMNTTTEQIQAKLEANPNVFAE